MRIIFVFIVAVFLYGCASIKPCSDSTLASLREDNSRLVEKYKTIEGYEVGKPIPGAVYSSLMKHELILAYKTSYNKSFDRLMYQAGQCS